MQTYLENQHNLAALLEQARLDGEIRIQREDGQIFVLKPENPKRSPLDVPGVNLDITTEEIIEFVREGRKPA